MHTKHYKILIPNSVKIALQKQIDYIAITQQQPLIALEWLDGIIKAIQSLEEFPNRCAIAPENEYLEQDLKTEIRHLIYKKSFRVIFIVRKNEVRILNVKHAARLTA